MTISFPVTKEEAEERYKKCRDKDPFPMIPPALLNSADLMDYARVSGMLFPFPTGADRIKGASIELPFTGELHHYKVGYFNQVGHASAERVTTNVANGDKVTLEPNQIYFLHLDTWLGLPHYLAARFNFSIKHVHAGLLLGTGPLVDPGFYGRILVPIHNLTSSKYEITGGDGLLWLEVTKISPNARWAASSGMLSTEGRTGSFVQFPEGKSDKPASWYFNKAQPSGRPIVSSLGPVLHSLEETLVETKVIKSSFDRNIWIGVIALAVSIGALLISAYQLFVAAKSLRYDGVDSKIEAAKKDFDKLGTEMKALEDRLKAVESNERPSKPPRNERIDAKASPAGK